MTINNTNNANSVAAFKNAFKGGTRPNRFNVSFSTIPPSLVSLLPNYNNTLKFKILATNFPDSNLGVATHYYRGRIVNFAGDRMYGNWAVTVYDDSNTAGNLWNFFHTWSERLDGHVTHQYDKTDFSYKDYMADFLITQHDINATAIRKITLKNVFPLTVGEIKLSMGENNLVRFDVLFTYDYISFPDADTINKSLQ